MSKTLDVGIRITADGKILATEVRAAKDAIGSLGEATRKAGADSSAYAEQTSMALDIVKSGVKGLAAGLAGLSFVGLARESAQLSQRYSELGIVLDVVGRNQGHTKEEVDSTTAAIQKQGISMIESRQVMATMVQANIDLTNATKLARLAQDAAVVGQMNSLQALANMIHGITSAQVEVLRGIGINVNFEQSYARLAKQMGVTQNELTEQEKLQARVNVVLAEAPKLAGVYEASMENAGKQMRSTARIVEDLKVKLGSVFDDSSKTAVSAYSAELKILNDRVDFLAASGQLKSWGRDIAMTFAQVSDVARNATNIVGGLISTAVANVDNLLKGDFRAIFESARQGGANLRAQLEDANHYQDALEKRFIVEDMLTDKVGRNNNVEQRRMEVTAAATEEVKKQITEYQRLLNSITEKTALNNAEVASTTKLTESGKIRIDVDTKMASGLLELNAQQKKSIDQSLQELSVSEKLLANKQFVRQQSEALANLGNNQTNQLRQQLEDQRAQNALIGKTREEIIAMAGAKERETAAVIRNAAVYAGDMHDAYMRYANDLETTGNLQQQLMQEQEVQRYAQQWNQTWSSIEQTGKQAFIQFAAHGRSAMQSIGDAIKTAILDLLYQLTMRKWMINIGASLESSLLGTAGATSASSGMSAFNVASLASNGLGLLKSGFGATSLLSSAGSYLPGSAGAFFGGMGVTGTQAAAEAGATALWGASGASTAASLGASVASFAGPAIAIAAVDQITRLIAGDKLIGGGVGEVLNYVPVVGPLLNGLFGRGPLKQKETQLTGDVGAEGLLDGYLTTNFKAKGGLLVGSKHDFAGVNLLTGAAETDNSKALSSVADGMVKYAQQLAQQINQSVGAVNTSLRSLSDTLGISARPLDDYRHSINLISESGKALTDEQVAAEIAAISDEMVKSLLPNVERLAKYGESSIQTITRLGAEFNALVSGAELLLGKSAADAKALVSGSTYQGRTAFVDAAGGLDAVNQKIQFFADNFLTESQRLAPVQEKLNAELNRLGLSSDLTREQFAALVQSFGQVNGISEETLQSLLNIQGAFVQVHTALNQDAIDRERMGLETQLLQLQGNTVELRRRELEALDPANRAIQTLIYRLTDQKNATAAAADAYRQEKEARRQALEQALEDVKKAVATEREKITNEYNAAVAESGKRIASVTDEIKRLTSVSDLLKSTVNSLNPITRDAAKMQIGSAVADTNAGKAIDIEKLRDALSVLTDKSTIKEQQGTFEFAREQAKTSRLVGTLVKSNDAQLLLQENTLTALEAQRARLDSGFNDQMTRLDTIISQAQQQVDLLTGISNNFSTIEDAVKNLTLATNQFAAFNGSGSDRTVINNNTTITLPDNTFSNGDGNANISDQTIRDYVAVHSNNPIDIYATALQQGISFEQYARATNTPLTDLVKWAQQNHLPVFASGGFHRGGLRLVGERGPELEVTGPSNIVSNDKLSNMLDNTAIVQKLEALIVELKKSTESNRKVANKLDAVTVVTINGQPALRTGT